jgi:tRNA(fMet)-specific endonuclease VapC
MDLSGSPSYLLDTNITAYIVDGRSQLARRMLGEALGKAPVAISSVTEAEILYGLALKPGAARRRDAVEKLFQAIEIKAWDSEAARAYSNLRARLRREGKSPAAMDLMIASQASALGAILVSHDKAFQHAAPYLRVEDWASDLV